MIDRYSRKELKEIWLDKNRYSLWLKIEIAAAEAMEKYKIIPKGVAKKVKSKEKSNFKPGFFSLINFFSYISLSKTI